MTQGENLRTFIVNSTSIASSTYWRPKGIGTAEVVEQDSLREHPPDPRIWFSRAGKDEEVDLDGSGGLAETSWDVEVQSADQDAAKDIADRLWGRLRGYRGTFGSTAYSVLGVFVEDQDDDYEWRGVASESVNHVSAMRVRVFSSS
jgi:hypothetical protein